MTVLPVSTMLRTLSVNVQKMKNAHKGTKLEKALV
jgi:hypothetical protein